MPTDRDKSEEAKERANNKSTSLFDIVDTLCPACNEPVDVLEPNPNEYIGEETENGSTNSRAACEISPKRILESDHSNPWDEIHIVPEIAVIDGSQELQVFAYKHDHSTEEYQAWKEQLDELNTVERRASENKGIGDFA